MAAPGFMFTFSSEMNPQVNCLLYAKSIVNCKPSALLACKPKQKLNAFAPSHALHLLSPPCPQCSQRVLQLTRHLACIYAGLLCHINLTTRAPQRHLITQPTLTTTSLRYIPVEGRSLSISDQAFWWCLMVWKKEKTSLPLHRLWASEDLPAVSVSSHKLI